MRIIGIDPGLSGGIAILEDNKVKDMFDMPVMADGKKNKRQLNSALLAQIVKDNIKDIEDTVIIVEQVNAMPGQGVTSMFNFGQSFGAIKGICAAIGLPIFLLDRQNGKNILNSLIPPKMPVEQKLLKCIHLLPINFQRKKT